MNQPSGFNIKGQPVTVDGLLALTGSICFLCHAKGATNVGVFVPNPEHSPTVVANTAEAFGPVREGAQRVIVYGICEECLRLGKPIIAEMVEAKMFAQGGAR